MGSEAYNLASCSAGHSGPWPESLLSLMQKRGDNQPLRASHLPGTQGRHRSPPTVTKGGLQGCYFRRSPACSCEDSIPALCSAQTSAVPRHPGEPQGAFFLRCAFWSHKQRSSHHYPYIRARTFLLRSGRGAPRAAGLQLSGGWCLTSPSSPGLKELSLSEAGEARAAWPSDGSSILLRSRDARP